MSASAPPVPQQLGPYELMRRIATGGMAEVYLARRGGPHGFEKLVAVKRILPQFGRDADFVAMFVDEARVCARLCHPNIVQVFDFGDHEADLYMAMEYVDGTTAAKLMRAAVQKGIEIPLEVTVYMVLSLLRALEYAHGARDDNGRPLDLVHRDVSPGNVLIDRSGAVKLTDFGIARAAEFERRTDVGQLKGKLGYMSPEQVVGKELDARSDLFTLAIVFAELVALRPLFSGGRELDVLLRIRDADLSSLDKSAHHVPDDVRMVLFKALARDPYARFPSAAAFADALDDIVRRRRLQMGPSRLAALLEELGLVQADDGEGGSDEDDTGLRSTAILEVDTLKGATLLEEERSPSQPPGELRDVAPAIYRLQFHDGSLLGPITYGKVLELLATGKVPDSTKVSREAGRFRELGECPELQRFVASPALRWVEDWPVGVSSRGPLERSFFPARLFSYALRRETGLLLLRDGARRKKVYLVDGSVEFTASTIKSELLGEFLVQRGQVLRMEVDMALAMSHRFGGRLGDSLVGLGVLRPVELVRAIHEQTKVRLVDLFQWRRGEVAFLRGARSHEETFPLGIDFFETVVRGIREGYTTQELEGILRIIEEEVLVKVASPPLRPETLRLSDKEMRVLQAVQGQHTLQTLTTSLAGTFGLDVADVYAAVFLGLSCQWLDAPGWSRNLSKSEILR